MSHTLPLPLPLRNARPLRLAALVLAVVALVATLFAPVPADAATRVIESSGNQEDGRWQAFDLGLDQSSVDIVATWTGAGNVNLFLQAGDGTNLAFANGNAKPELISYAGNQTPSRLVVLVKSGSASYQVTVTTDTDTTTPPPPRPSTGSYPGQPPAGKVLWGASIQYNGDPYARHERYVDGEPMGVRRTFWSWNQRSSGVLRTAREDVAAGRVPWLSLKTPSWRSMAQGDHDTAIDSLLRELDKLNGPVWLTFHHEPEGGHGSNSADDAGGPAAHKDMNRRIRSRMNRLGTDNIALAPILMAWTFNPNSGRDPGVWWDADIYDFLGVDVYRGAPGTLLIDRWYLVRRWAGRAGVDVAVGEWALEGSGATTAGYMRDFHRDAVRSHNDGKGARVVAAAYFDSQRDGRWLSGDMLGTFRNLIADSGSHHG